ncbi:rod shape-determining protein MreD [Thiocystis minor]|uniref:rod shape-determining protein MreD n=1 Tax=Thiocystis minor TaxID=61597 RepID=UPI001914673B|nr:rod shape-determining protein MreD [Thiocystis minor]MBK5966137.1 rod shape-determining protein MreD [Thiocystis minor]
MSETERRGLWMVLSSLALAMFLTIVPMPAGLEDFRPQWVTLTLLFWCLTLPERVGVFWGFGTGLMLDVLTASVLGQQALGLSLVAYVAVKLHARIRLFPLWQQSFFVWVLLLAERLLTLWILGATGQPMPTLSYWVPTFIGLLIWPWLSAALTQVERRMGTD